MPKIGEIRSGTELGYNSRPINYIYHACEDCGVERWVRLTHGSPKYRFCKKCCHKWVNLSQETVEKFLTAFKNTARKGPLNAFWKGGRYKNYQGYMAVYVPSDDPLYSMCQSGGYILEHRLVMARHLGRCLRPWEVVHHKNGLKDDNRLENLGLLSCGSVHNRELNKRVKALERQVSYLENRVTVMEAENIMLNRQLELDGGSKLEQEPKIQQITYFRQVHPPTLKQFVYRKAVREAMATLKGKNGVTVHPDTGNPVPESALAARNVLKGLTADELLKQHPEWRTDYEKNILSKQ